MVSYWLFKEILLMFSHILVVSTGYILLLSICPMLKAGKLHSIASSAKYLESYLKITLRVQKYGGVLLNCTKIPLIFCVGSFNTQSALWVDFKVESVLQSRRKKIKFYIYLPSYLANEKKWEQLQLTLDNSDLKMDKAIIRIKQICSRQW